MIPESFNYLQVIILDMLSVFGLMDIDPFLFLKLINNFVTINRPNLVDDLIPSHPHLICIPFLAIFEVMVSQDTAQPLVLFI